MPTTEPNQGDTLRGTPALCQGYPGAILPAEGLGPLLGLTQVLFKEDWAAWVSAALRSQEEEMAKEAFWLVTAIIAAPSPPQPPGSILLGQTLPVNGEYTQHKQLNTTLATNLLKQQSRQ
ncbi:hypothetical protein PoB_002727100 [Plakobranchus ocellatus]|uniref:Uncharacterized protein n=1 Tax=Plakobranchus ocellatus TaxID=259542 RepID=A0AAV4A225_9GAST|nr:hypothetical protein PoB_002727100 [Plakobranchus ocellatus]